MPPTGVVIDAGLVRSLIATQYPHWSALPVTPVSPGGWDNRSFRLGDRMLVRLPSAPAYVAQVDKEQTWLPRLAPHLPLPIPVPLAKGLPGEGYPWPWSVYGWLAGETVSRETVTDWTTLARAVARFLAALHGVDPAGGPPPGPHNFQRGGPVATYDAETRRALGRLGQRLDTVVALDLWNAARASVWQGPPRWLHGDLAAGNLLVQDGALCAVIDFGCAAVGDPACDLVIAWTLFSGESRAAFRDALPLDEDTWARARGWCLWKALITAADEGKGAVERESAWRVLGEVMGDSGRSGS